MGMYDYFEPDPPIECPKCGGQLSGWEGKDCQRLLLFWRQGVAAPVDQRGDPQWRASPEKMANFRVSPLFRIYGGECPCGYKFDDARFSLRCAAPNGIWITTAVEPAPIVAKDTGDRWIQCSACCDVWEAVAGRRLYLCPGCGELTRLEGAR